MEQGLGHAPREEARELEPASTVPPGWAYGNSWRGKPMASNSYPDDLGVWITLGSTGYHLQHYWHLSMPTPTREGRVLRELGLVSAANSLPGRHTRQRRAGHLLSRDKIEEVLIAQALLTPLEASLLGFEMLSLFEEVETQVATPYFTARIQRRGVRNAYRQSVFRLDRIAHGRLTVPGVTTHED